MKQMNFEGEKQAAIKRMFLHDDTASRAVHGFTEEFGILTGEDVASALSVSPQWARTLARKKGVVFRHGYRPRLPESIEVNQS